MNLETQNQVVSLYLRGISSPKLAEYGVIPSKSFRTVAPEALCNNKHFWRGLVDADGTIDSFCNGTNVNYPRLRLIGSKILMTQYLDFVKTIVVCKASVLPHKSIFEVGLGGISAMPVLKNLYHNSSIYLDRKYTSMLDLVNNNEGVY